MYVTFDIWLDVTLNNKFSLSFHLKSVFIMMDIVVVYVVILFFLLMKMVIFCLFVLHCGHGFAFLQIFKLLWKNQA
jgi:hypothetical protein